MHGLVVEVDADMLYSEIHIEAALAWPHDEQRRRQWTAAWSGWLLHSLGQPTPDPQIARQEQEWAERRADDYGLDAAALLALAYEATEAHVRGALFEPAGGMGTVIEGPATRALLTEMLRHYRSGLLAGELLLTVAAMAEHHRELRPSLNRAIAVMEARSDKEPGRNERVLKDTWSRWRCVAPFWAARCAMSAPRGCFVAVPSWSTAEEQARGFRTLFGLTEGLRQFAAGYKPARSQGPLIPEGETLEFRAGVPAVMPLLPPLPPVLYEAARAYTVRAIRQ